MKARPVDFRNVSDQKITCIHFFKPRHIFRVAVEVARRHITSFHSYLRNVILFVRASIACRTLQKVSKPVDMYLMQ